MLNLNELGYLLNANSVGYQNWQSIVVIAAESKVRLVIPKEAPQKAVRLWIKEYLDAHPDYQGSIEVCITQNRNGWILKTYRYSPSVESDKGYLLNNHPIDSSEVRLKQTQNPSELSQDLVQHLIKKETQANEPVAAAGPHPTKALIREFADEFENFKRRFLTTKSGLFYTKGSREISAYLEKIQRLPDAKLPSQADLMQALQKIIKNRLSVGKDERRNESVKSFYSTAMNSKSTLQSLSAHMKAESQVVKQREEDLQAEQLLDWNNRRGKFYFISSALEYRTGNFTIRFLGTTPFGNSPTGIKQMIKLLKQHAGTYTTQEMFLGMKKIAQARLEKNVGTRRSLKTKDFYDFICSINDNDPNALDKVMNELFQLKYLDQHHMNYLKQSYPGLTPKSTLK